MMIFVFKSYFRVIRLYMSVFSSIFQKEMAINLTRFYTKVFRFYKPHAIPPPPPSSL